MVLLELLDETIQTIDHGLTTVLTDDIGHLKLRMLIELIELPGMEVGDEVAIMAKRPVGQYLIPRPRQVME